MKKIYKFATIAVSGLLAMPLHAETYGVLMKTLSNPFWGAMELGVREGAESSGVEYYLQAVESDQAAEPQLNVCNTMLERKPDAMITAAINSTILLPCLKRANEMEIPVVDLDGNLDHKIAADAGVDIAFSIGSDNVAAGAQGAQWLVDKLGELAPELKVVASLPGDWDRGKAANITNDILTANPDLVAIFAANDGMALGAIETIYAANKQDQVTVIGVDGNSDAVKSIKAGRLNASVAQLPYLVGKQAVEMVKAMKEGKAPEGDWIYVPTMVLTKSVLEEGKEPMLEYVK